ncbi:MAG: HPr family phosphocarrier protein [Myxococcales bacterium FL481]|nr:MAG: HPr family phosphocarrier protein [Myxococcales bacterium FL481]
MSKKPTDGELEIVNPLGLHARAASKFVSVANRFDADVWIGKDGQEVNGKSILGVLMLAAAVGSKVTVRCAGRDAGDAFAGLSALIQDGFGEL